LWARRPFPCDSPRYRRPPRMSFLTTVKQASAKLIMAWGP
jgi:hypothetical protein